MIFSPHLSLYSRDQRFPLLRTKLRNCFELNAARHPREWYRREFPEGRRCESVLLRAERERPASSRSMWMGNPKGQGPRVSRRHHSWPPKVWSLGKWTSNSFKKEKRDSDTCQLHEFLLAKRSRRDFQRRAPAWRNVGPCSRGRHEWAAASRAHAQERLRLGPNKTLDLELLWWGGSRGGERVLGKPAFRPREKHHQTTF